MTRSYSEESEQSAFEFRVAAMLESLVYSVCEVCWHETREHHQPGILHMPSECKQGDCPCQNPAQVIRLKELNKVFKEIFGMGYPPYKGLMCNDDKTS